MTPDIFMKTLNAVFLCPFIDLAGKTREEQLNI
jgi:hypothetical protein